MKLESLREQIPDFGRDIKLNLDSVLSTDNDLTPAQTWGTALACAFALGAKELVELVKDEAAPDDALIGAAQIAATIMAMNNVYYRSMHLMEDPELKKLRAGLRMNAMAKPGVEKADFELMCFAVSALAGCGQCLTAHLNELRKAGVADTGIQASLKIASVLNAAHSALRMAQL